MDDDEKLDEISIKKRIEYSKNYEIIEGFEDFNNGERYNRLDSQIILRGIYRNRKLPFEYFMYHTNMIHAFTAT